MNRALRVHLNAWPQELKPHARVSDEHDLVAVVEVTERIGR